LTRIKELAELCRIEQNYKAAGLSGERFVFGMEDKLVLEADGTKMLSEAELTRIEQN